MSTVISLSAYRARQDRTPEDAPAATDRLARAQDSLAQASRALHGLTVCLDEVARRLGRPDEAMRARAQHRVGLALDKLHQARADAAELTRLIEAGDIAGCEQLRDTIRARGEG
ncbi:MAG: hypothetical protein JO021_24885 [Alphaproteobacteria bacterium]|nr:hypothetical protein [Alphaproteobacteria bacterium]